MGRGQIVRRAMALKDFEEPVRLFEVVGVQNPIRLA